MMGGIHDPGTALGFMFLPFIIHRDRKSLIVGKQYIEKYDAGFIQGVLIGAWPKVCEMVKMMWEKQEIPFN